MYLRADWRGGAYTKSMDHHSGLKLSAEKQRTFLFDSFESKVAFTQIISKASDSTLLPAGFYGKEYFVIHSTD